MPSPLFNDVMNWVCSSPTLGMAWRRWRRGGSLLLCAPLSWLWARPGGDGGEVRCCMGSLLLCASGCRLWAWPGGRGEGKLSCTSYVTRRRRTNYIAQLDEEEDGPTKVNGVLMFIQAPISSLQLQTTSVNDLTCCQDRHTPCKYSSFLKGTKYCPMFLAVRLKTSHRTCFSSSSMECHVSGARPPWTKLADFTWMCKSANSFTNIKTNGHTDHLWVSVRRSSAKGKWVTWRNTFVFTWVIKQIITKQLQQYVASFNFSIEKIDNFISFSRSLAAAGRRGPAEAHDIQRRCPGSWYILLNSFQKNPVQSNLSKWCHMSTQT